MPITLLGAAPTATLETLPNGLNGTRLVLRRMVEIAREARAHPHINTLALQIARYVRSYDRVGEAKAVQTWVQRMIRYRRDVRTVETLRHPLITLELRAGDCDDQAVLVASLLESIGHTMRFKVYGGDENAFEHVLAQTYLPSARGDNWFALETIRPWAFGREPSARVIMQAHV